MPRIARIPTQRVFRTSTNASDGEINVIGTQGSHLKWPADTRPRIQKGGALRRTFVPSEEAKKFGEKRQLPAPKGSARAWVPTSEQKRDTNGRFTAPLPKKPTRSIVTGKEFT